MEQVRQIVFNCIENLNRERPDSNKVMPSLDTLLLAEGGSVDSLELVSLIVDIETAVAESYGFDISLTDDEAMSRHESPFLSVETLCDYINEVVPKH